jgi:hypothetical protein
MMITKKKRRRRLMSDLLSGLGDEGNEQSEVKVMKVRFDSGNFAEEITMEHEVSRGTSVSATTISQWQSLVSCGSQ